MGPGFVEIISLLMGLSGFGVQANPKAPSVDVSLQYAMADADVVVHIDAVSLVPNNYKVLQSLPTNASIKASPDLVTAVRKAIGEVEGARGLAKKMTGIDVVTDIYDADFFVQLDATSNKPKFVAVVHGKFSTANIDAIGKGTGTQVQKIGGGAMISMGATDPAVAVTKDGVMLAGTPDLVKARLADTWKAPTRAPNSALAYAAEVLAQKPVFSVTTVLSAAAKKHVLAEMGGRKNLGTDLVQRGKMSSFSVFADGVGWNWIDSTKTGLDNMEMMSQGFLELMKAGHIAPRAIAKLMLGAIDSYRGTDKQLDAVIARKGEVLKVMNAYSGDGNFQQSVVKDTKTLRLTVRATAKTLSEVVPAGVMIPVGMAFVMLRAGDPAQAPSPVLVQPAPPARSGNGLAPKKK